MATTPNYGWVMPDPTDFVTDLPADFEIFGDAADASVKALNPGTTAGDVDYYTSSTAKARLGIGTAGQVLAVNTGATAPEWVTPATSPITTEGDLIVGDASGDPVRVAVGTAGQILASDGDTVEWVTPAAGGAFTLISTTSLSGTQVSLTSLPTTFRHLFLSLTDVNINSNATIQLRFNSDTGNNYGHSGISTGSVSGSNDQPEINLTGPTFVGSGSSANNFSIYINDYRTGRVNVSSSGTIRNNSNQRAAVLAGGAYISSVSSLQIRCNGQTFNGGTATLFGVQ